MSKSKNKISAQIYYTRNENDFISFNITADQYRIEIKTPRYENSGILTKMVIKYYTNGNPPEMWNWIMGAPNINAT